MQIFSKLLTVTLEDLDELNHVNNVKYIQWVNDIAIEHWNMLSSSKVRESYFWVLMNHNINYKSSAILGDIIRLTTFVEKSKGVTSTRIVEMHNNETGNLIARSETNWCLMDSTSKRPTRIPTEIITIFE